MTFISILAVLVAVVLAFWLITGLGRLLPASFRRKSAPYTFEYVEDLPDTLQPLKLYLAGSEQSPWAAAMVCPCGCKARIELNLLQAARPCWTAITHADGTATLRPSVWRQKGCESHFFLRNGLVEWC